MKMKTVISVVLAMSAAQIARGQGGLSPTGAPGPVMRTLQQIEPRTPVNLLPGDSQATHIISTPGSYYLSESISGNTGKMGIRIDAVSVTLDLNGFTLEGVFGSTVGIFVSAGGGPVTIRNGNLRFWTTGGIVSFGGARLTVEDLDIMSISAGPGVWGGSFAHAARVRTSGTSFSGIQLDADSMATHCLVENFAANDWSFGPEGANPVGIQADRVVDCTVRGFSGGNAGDSVSGIYGEQVERGLVENCNFLDRIAIGIFGELVRGSHVINLSGTANDLSGIYGAVLEDNVVIDVGGPDKVGVQAGGYQSVISGNLLLRNKIKINSDSDVSGNRVSVGNTNTAVDVTGGENRISGNTISTDNSSTGIRLAGPGNLVRDNAISVGTLSKGIRVESAGNLISGNNIRQGANSTGIDFGTGGAFCRIDENTISGGAWGIVIPGGSSGVTNNLVTRNFVGGPSNGYITFSSGTQWSGITLDDNISTNHAWVNFGQ